jgi:glycerophosphoryl diester phosphodiesterase
MKPKIIAHRGYAKTYPENTLSAFKAALVLGSDSIELDVHSTSDNKLVIHHDYYLGNPDNGRGVIHKADSSYLQKLRIEKKEKIPTLEAVFELIGDQMDYEIELKGFGDHFLKLVLEQVKRFGLLERIEFTSPHPYAVTRIKQLDPKVITGIFVAAPPTWMDKELAQLQAINNGLQAGANVLHCPITILDKSFITKAHLSNIQIHAADCDEEKSLNQALSLGVDQLSTNELELALALREQAA